MRLLHVVPTYLPAVRYGGPIRSVHALCRELAAAGHDVEVFTTSVDGPTDSNVPLMKEIMLKEYRFPPELVEKLKTDFALDLAPKASDYQIIIDKMLKYGMLKKPMKPEEAIATP